jgi:hypothetical protein
MKRLKEREDEGDQDQNETNSHGIPPVYMPHTQRRCLACPVGCTCPLIGSSKAKVRRMINLGSAIQSARGVSVLLEQLDDVFSAPSR